MKTIQVLGKRWFEKQNGNTYHSVRVYLDNEFLGENKFAYGYGSHYQQTALEILQKHLPDLKDVKVLWRVKDKGYKLLSDVTDVSRKRDL